MCIRWNDDDDDDGEVAVVVAVAAASHVADVCDVYVERKRYLHYIYLYKSMYMLRSTCVVCYRCEIVCVRRYWKRERERERYTSYKMRESCQESEEKKKQHNWTNWVNSRVAIVHFLQRCHALLNLFTCIVLRSELIWLECEVYRCFSEKKTFSRHLIIL